MGKYNNGSSIPISSLSNEELKIAVKDWAQGNDEAEKFLLECYKKGIETHGCHTWRDIYIDFIANEPRKNLIKLLNYIQNKKDTELHVYPDGAINVFSGPDWYKPTISISYHSKDEEDSKNIFTELTNFLELEEKQDDSEPNIYGQMLDFYDFFGDKDSRLSFIAQHTSDGLYRFQIETYKDDKDLNYFKELFNKAKMKINPNPSPYEDFPYIQWEVKDENPKVVAQKMEKIKEIIFKEWSLEPATEEFEEMSQNALFKMKKRQFGDSLEGQEKMKEWMKQKKIELDKKFEEYFRKKQAPKEKFTDSIKVSQEVIDNINNIQNNSSSGEKNNGNNSLGDEEK